MKNNIFTLFLLIVSLSSCGSSTDNKIQKKPVIQLNSVVSKEIIIKSPEQFFKWIFINKRDEEESLSKIKYHDCIELVDGYFYLAEYINNGENKLIVFKIEVDGSYKVGKEYSIPDKNIKFAKLITYNSKAYAVIQLDITSGSNSEEAIVIFIPVDIDKTILHFSESSSFHLPYTCINTCSIQGNHIIFGGWIDKSNESDKTQKPYIGKFSFQDNKFIMEKFQILNPPFFGDSNVFGSEIEKIIIDPLLNIYFFTNREYLGKLNVVGEIEFLKKVGYFMIFDVFFDSKQNGIVVLTSKNLQLIDHNGNIKKIITFPTEWINGRSGFYHLTLMENGYLIYGSIYDSNFDIADRLTAIFYLNKDWTSVECSLTPQDLFYPLFISERNGALFLTGGMGLSFEDKIGFLFLSTDIRSWLTPTQKFSMVYNQSQIDSFSMELNRVSKNLYKDLLTGEYFYYINNKSSVKKSGKTLVTDKNITAKQKDFVLNFLERNLTNIRIDDN
jgi:hypothetical protein